MGQCLINVGDQCIPTFPAASFLPTSGGGWAGSGEGWGKMLFYKTEEKSVHDKKGAVYSPVVGLTDL
jgi:hypothetical protein